MAIENVWPRAGNLLSGVALFATANTVLITLIATSRLAFAMGRDGEIPDVFAKVLPGRLTPWIATLLTFGLAADSTAGRQRENSSGDFVLCCAAGVSFCQCRLDRPPLSDAGSSTAIPGAVRGWAATDPATGGHCLHHCAADPLRLGDLRSRPFGSCADCGGLPGSTICASCQSLVGRFRRRTDRRDAIAALNPEFATGRVSRALPVHTVMRNSTRDEGGPFGLGDQEQSPSHCKLLRSKAVMVSVAAQGSDLSPAGEIEVWEAFKHVKANQGAAGMDDCGVRGQPFDEPLQEMPLPSHLPPKCRLRGICAADVALRRRR